MDYENLIFELMDAEPAVYGGAVLDRRGTLLYQTENWELSQDLPKINEAINESQKENGEKPSRIEIMKIGYMVVEFTPERIIATNVMHKGHIIIAMSTNGTLVAYIDPKKGPRDALFNVQTFARKL